MAHPSYDVVADLVIRFGRPRGDAGVAWLAMPKSKNLLRQRRPLPVMIKAGQQDGEDAGKKNAVESAGAAD
jgi:hypothetical protein